MPLTNLQRQTAWVIFRLIAERDMPSNNTSQRLVERSGMPGDQVLWAIELLWNDDAGFVLVDENRATGERGYYVDPKCRRKTAKDLDVLFALWEVEQDDDSDEDDDEDGDEWDERDNDDGDDD